jgi:hypothetical protein
VLHTIASWLLTPTGRLSVAALVFAVLWLIKNLPVVQAFICTDRRKLVANGLLSLLPAAALLADPGVPAEEAWAGFVETAFVAAGLQGALKVLVGERLKALLRLGAPPTPTTPATPAGQ